MSLEEALKPYIDPRWSFFLAVSIGPGWEPLVLDTHKKLVEITRDYRISQIKEKFGGLRFYAYGFGEDHAAAYRVLNDAEVLSYKICEQCGTTDDVTTEVLGPGQWWLFTLCSTCRASRFNERQARDSAVAPEDDEDM